MDEHTDDVHATPDLDPVDASQPTIDRQALLDCLEDLQRSLDRVREVLGSFDGPMPTFRGRPRGMVGAASLDPEGTRIIEGVFDGQNMVGPDGKQYSVPANYASKSKLVEGDVLKLTITKDGSFIYKQIGPVDRQRLVGTLVRDESTGEYRAQLEAASYKILLASVTYFKGEAGDEVVILVPDGKESRWAAVENIIKPGQSDQDPLVSPL